MSDLEKYEKEYLDRLNNKKKELSEEEKKATAEAEKTEQEEISKEIENLDNTDYTILEAQRTENILLALNIGVEETLNSIEKLIRCKLIKKADREPTFSEKETFTLTVS